ncbi:hypothetical protein [Bifidobacterium myosotis]|uniref:Uncharacterized protein n=1 Tax=Bifidobacterium myosotis TaxID=1630166 RepID=A0A5M9ZH77_9BIFI|nr:hypothetical protein [Bifidobacterium myosotis]KAA8826954.1 hypothetical protein EMO91_10510 [Bifidobacterium myosotis]
MVMDAYYAVEITCRSCGTEFIGTFEPGPDSYTTRYHLCPDCYEEAAEEGTLGEYDDYAD